jgi:hypothetical protein
MLLIDFLKNLFRRGRLQKKTLASVNPEEIRRERIKVEQTEIRVTREIEELEQQKEVLFRKGVECASDRQKVQVARKIKELDTQVRARDQQLTLVSKNLRILNGVAQLKENERLLQDLGMEGLVSQMDLQELQTYVEQATIEGQFQMERFTGLLDSIDDAEGVFAMADEDEDTMAIVKAMNQVAETGAENSVTEGMRELDEVLRKRTAPVAQLDSV